jgi:hypothetical protein
MTKPIPLDLPSLTTISAAGVEINISDAAFAVAIERFVIELARANIVPAAVLEPVRDLVNLRCSARGDAPQEWQKMY